MIDLLLLEEIVTKAIPFEQADCKRIKAKKEWRREQLKEQILAWHRKCIFATGGTLQGPVLFNDDNPNRKEHILTEAELKGIREFSIFDAFKSAIKGPIKLKE